MTDPRERRITARAFDLWQAEGALDGRSLSHWLQAEKEVDEELAQAPSALCFCHGFGAPGAEMRRF
ncbi:DUF2934 domain-containing protein [Shinella sp. M27]|uniref:DUF2934 domain-containing protein n=1 Tax=Shinella sp. M27 TaxID=3368614 RepID=UPI003BA2B615